MNYVDVVVTAYATVSSFTLKFVFTLSQRHYSKILVSSFMYAEVSVLTTETLIMMSSSFYSFDADVIRNVDIGIALLAIGILLEDL
jgi:hypothetical protein